MAPRLERFVSPGKGNGLRATASIRRGELVYSTEPLACCVSNRLARDVCHHCFTRWMLDDTAAFSTEAKLTSSS
ncbi:histone-lysine N-methyltransferase SMYD3 isoform X1 [Lates japonicus]|uniref:Histone-lysine N-methyltransferase SMYD3 isoform X1 n=1 Tax=Lates japonicus TaxID=270547 RepID=A0AAD3NDH2_LATJO|nr:histone-lysine N-methyltransferase SMYD3 isoform X1 [Lates japonicus]